MRAYNFCAGPAALPEAVLKQAQAEMLDYHGKGLSVMEMSHRSADYVAIAEQAEQDLRDLMNIPSNYKVLFLQGGASQQFAMIPMNLLRGKTTARTRTSTAGFRSRASSATMIFGRWRRWSADGTVASSRKACPFPTLW